MTDIIKINKAWNEIYISGKQFNEYPYDFVVSATKKYIKNTNKKNVLDLGCGAGNHISFFLNSEFKLVTGIDSSKIITDFLDKKYKKNKKVEIINNDISKMVYRKNFYGLVLDRMSITHNNKDEIKQTIDKVYNSLKKNGYFFSVCFSDNHNEYTNKKKINNQQYFNNLVKGTGITSSFLNYNDVKIFYKKFEKVSIIENISFNHQTNKKTAIWSLILKKK